MKIQQTNTKKGSLTTKSVFYVLMIIMMVWLIIFGMQKIFLVEKTIKTEDKILVKKEIENALKYCSDPLNKGNLKTIKLNNLGFNSICLINKNTNLNEINLLKESPELIEEINILKETMNQSDSLGILIQTTIDTQNNELIKANIKDKILLRNIKTKSFCSWDTENKDRLDLEIIC